MASGPRGTAAQRAQEAKRRRRERARSEGHAKADRAADGILGRPRPSEADDTAS